MKIKLSDAFDLQMGKTPSRNNLEYWNGEHKWVAIGDLGNAGKYISHTKECISDEGVAESGIKPVPAGTVIMSFKLSIGKTAITTEEIYTNEAIMAFIDKKAYPIDVNYIYHLFNGMDWSEGSNKAVLGVTLNKATLSQKTINIPDINKQRSVALILDKLDDVISLRKQQLAKLDELVKARFVEMFGEIVEMVPLSHYINELVAGKSLAGERECPNKVLKTGAATYDSFDPTQVKNLPLDYIPQPEHLLKTGDIIISRMNTLELVGAAAYVWEAPSNTYLPDRLWKAKLQENVQPIFVWQTLIQATTKECIHKIASGTSGSMKNISKGGLLDIQVKKVDLEYQKKFSNAVTQIYKQKLTIQQSLDKLMVLKKSLMQEYFG